MNQAIITSALHLINKNGLHTLCLEEIAQSIGISNQEIKNYFETKNSLIEYLLEEHLKSMELHLHTKSQTDTLYTLLSSLTEKTLISQEEHGYLPRLSKAFLPYIDSFELKYRYKKFYNDLHQFYMKDLEERIKNNELNEELDTYTLATMLVSMVDSNVLHNGSFKYKKKLSKEFHIEKFFYLYFKLLQHYVKVYKTYLNKISNLTNIFQRYKYL